ncbi:MAG: hypothetical protein SNG27_07500, partial [Rikenellaceae bacterium]
TPPKNSWFIYFSGYRYGPFFNYLLAPFWIIIYSDKQINGVSLSPVIRGKQLSERDLFLHRSYEDQHCAIIRGDWKLISYTSGKVELYNIASDISETTNLAEVNPKRTSQMLSSLEEWIKEATPKEIVTQ